MVELLWITIPIQGRHYVQQLCDQAKFKITRDFFLKCYCRMSILMHKIYISPFATQYSPINKLLPAAPSTVLCTRMVILISKTPVSSFRTRPTDTAYPPCLILSSRGCGRSGWCNRIIACFGADGQPRTWTSDTYDERVSTTSSRCGAGCFWKDSESEMRWPSSTGTRLQWTDT